MYKKKKGARWARSLIVSKSVLSCKNKLQNTWHGIPGCIYQKDRISRTIARLCPDVAAATPSLAAATWARKRPRLITPASGPANTSIYSGPAINCPNSVLGQLGKEERLTNRASGLLFIAEIAKRPRRDTWRVFTTAKSSEKRVFLANLPFAATVTPPSDGLLKYSAWSRREMVRVFAKTRHL